MQAIFVTGGTGNQGGAVARHLLQKGFHVKALARDPSSALAQSLGKQGAEIIKGDLNQPETYKQYLKDVYGVFSVQALSKDVDNGVRQGIQLADMAMQNNVKHFIYSSVVGANLKTRIPHWDSKFQIENHIRNINLPNTIIRPASFYENFLLPQVKSRILKGKLVVPLDKNVVQQIVSVEDVGTVSATILMNPEKYISRIITLATEEMDQGQMANVFSEGLGKEIKFQKLPSIITRLAMGKDLHTMFQWINKHSGVFVENMEDLKNEFPGMLSLKQWIRQNFNKTSH